MKLNSQLPRTLCQPNALRGLDSLQQRVEELIERYRNRKSTAKPKPHDLAKSA